MADSLLDNYNPLYDIHLRQYFASPHMQKHLQKMGLLESTLNLNGDEVYARHHAMMDMMLKNREAQLLKMAELRKKLDAAEKVEICRRIRTGQSPESYRRGKPSRSLSRSRASQKSGGRQRRFSNSYEDRDFVQHIEERNADPDDYDTRDPYKRLSANAKRFNYLHKLDDKTLIAYKDNLKQQLQRLERFREISFGPHSVARQPPPPQASWFFRRRSLPSLTAPSSGNPMKEPLRSVLNMRGRKTTTGNKLNLSHDSRTSCPPTTRKRKDSNTRLPPINPQRGRVATKPPAPMTLQQTTSKLPPAAKKPAPTRGRPSDKRQTTTTTTTTITTISKSPHNNTTTFSTLPSVTGHGVFSGAAAAATVAAIGTAAIAVDQLISDEPMKTPTPSPPISPATETREVLSSPTEDLPADIHEDQHYEPEPASEDEQEHHEDVVAPVSHSHGDYEDSDSEPEYAEEDRQTPEDVVVRQMVQQATRTPTQPHEELAVETNLSHEVHLEKPESPKEIDYSHEAAQSPAHSERRSPVASEGSLPSPVVAPPTLQSPVHSEDALPSPVQSEVVPAPQSPVASVARSIASENDIQQNEETLTLHEDHEVDDHQHQRIETIEIEPHEISAPVSPVLSEKEIVRAPSSHSEHESEHVEEVVAQSPAQSVRSSRASSKLGSHHEEVQSHVDTLEDSPEHNQLHEQSPSPVLSNKGVEYVEQHVDAQKSPTLSVHSHHAVEHFEQHDVQPQSPVVSIHGENAMDVHEDDHPQSPALSVDTSSHFEHHEEVVHYSPRSPSVEDNVQEKVVEHSAPQSRAHSITSSHHSEKLAHSPNQHEAPQSPSEHSAHHVDAHSPAPESPVELKHETFQENEPDRHGASDQESENAHEHIPAAISDDAHEDERVSSKTSAPHSPAVSEKNDFAPRSPSVHTSDASEHDHAEEEESFEVHHHAPLSHSQVEIEPAHIEQAPPSPTEHELYNPNGNAESPVQSDDEEIARFQNDNFRPDVIARGVAIADRLDLEEYHNSPTKESTSPVTTNPVEIRITAEQVADQISADDSFAREQLDDRMGNFNDNETSNIIAEAVTEAAAIIDSVAYQEHHEAPVHDPEAYELNYSQDNENTHQDGIDAMTTSVYQPSSDHGGSQTSLEPETTTKIKEWDNGDEHVEETVTRSEFSNGGTHQTYSETVTVITNKPESPLPDAHVSPNDAEADNISTDSLIIHDNQHSSDYQMTQSIYEPKTEIEEKEWDEGAKHVHEVISNVEHVDSTGKHFTETITTTTTVIKSGDDMENNNDDDEKEQDDEHDVRSTIEEEEEYSTNGNVHHRKSTTGLPEGGILVDDGDETNISSL